MALYGRARGTRLLVVSLVMLSLVTITVDFRAGRSGPLEAAGRAALTVVAPLQEAVSGVVRPIGAFFSGITRVASLHGRNRELEAQLARLQHQSAQAVSVQRENVQLRKLLGLKQELRLEGVAAEVIGESVANYEWSVTIDRGSSDGVRRNMAVVTGDGLVGHVVEVAAGWSKVQLILDPRSFVAAKLATSQERGGVVGQRDQDLRMELVDKDAKVTRGDLVVTSTYGRGLYPPHILIGQVSGTEPDPSGLTKVIRVRPAVDFSSLSVVLVVTRR